MTIAEALHVADRPVSFRDAEVLLADCLGVTREYLFAHPEESLTPAQAKSYAAALARREQNEPVAYITGHKEFYGRDFRCDRRALIPRPETEGVVERTLANLPHPAVPNLKILELGTGCGTIAITLALELLQRRQPGEIIATDLSAEALDLARENAQALAPHLPLTFVQADLFQHPLITTEQPFDFILANLPYVPDTWKADPAAQPDVVFHEPDLALFGGDSGLALYTSFFQEVGRFLTPTGYIIIEHGEDQTAALHHLIQRSLPGRTITTYPDYAGLDRVTEVA